jgi:HlyD family secretion protein
MAISACVEWPTVRCRATRATGDFDLRTFSIRAYPVDKVPELRPGMSAYLDWRARE